MSYSTRYDPKRYQAIEGILEKVKGLQPGHQINVDGLSRESLNRVRQLIYDWLSHHSLKPLFRLKTEYNRSRLIILNIGTPDTLLITKEAPLGADLDVLLQELIIAEPTDAEETLREWLAKGKISSLSNATKILERYEEVMK